MPEITPIEELDILIEMQNPLFIYSTDSFDEQMAFTEYINSLSNRRILLSEQILFDAPFIAAGLQESHIETIIKEGSHKLKRGMFTAFSNHEFLINIQKITEELDQRQKTAKNSARFNNIMQYLRDSRFII